MPRLYVRTEDLARVIEQYLDHRGMSTTDLGRYAKVDPSTISKILNRYSEYTTEVTYDRLKIAMSKPHLQLEIIEREN